MKLEEISPYLVDATISVEDKNFYEHGGVDLAGVARAVLSNLFGIGEPSGEARFHSSCVRTYMACSMIHH